MDDASLAERLEKATEGSRAFDEEIVQLLFPAIEQRDGKWYLGDLLCSIQPYSTDLGSAMVTIPKDYRLSLDESDDGSGWAADLATEEWRDAGVAFVSTQSCVTPELAVCSASVRARERRDG